MPFNHKKNIPLSSEMTELKKEIHTLHLDNASTMKKIHQGSRVLATIAGGLSSSIHMLGSMLWANKKIPVIGFYIQMLAMIPKAIETLTDPKKSVGEKVFSTVFLATLVSLSIAAFVVGALFAAIVGTVVSSIITAIEGLGLIGKIVEKYQLSNTYQKKRDFNELIDNKKIPENNQFDQLFAVRAVELRELLKKSHISKEDQQKIKEELNFVEEVLQKNNIAIDQTAGSPTAELQNLYKEREVKLAELVQKIAIMKSGSATQTDTFSEEIQLIQNDILRIDEQINDITAPVEVLNAKNMIATEKVFLSMTNFSVALSGTLLSIIGLVMFASAAVMPPAIIGGVVGLGIGLSTISFAKYIGEKIADYQDAAQQEKKEKVQKEAILEEALYEYELNPSLKVALSLGSGNTKRILDLLTSQPANQPREKSAPEQSQTLPVTSSPVTPTPVLVNPVNPVHFANPVFAKQLTSTVTHEQETTTTPRTTYP